MAAISAQVPSRSPLLRGAPRRPVRGGGWGLQRRVLRQPAHPAHPVRPVLEHRGVAGGVPHAVDPHAGEGGMQHLRHVFGQFGGGGGVLAAPQPAQHRDSRGHGGEGQAHRDGGDHPPVAAAQLGRALGGAVMRPEHPEHLLSPAFQQRVIDEDNDLGRAGAGDRSPVGGMVRPSSSGHHFAAGKNRWNRSWRTSPLSPAPTIMPQIVRRPVCAASPATRAQKVRNVGTVKQAENRLSTAISEAEPVAWRQRAFRPGVSRLPALHPH
jgi:hypothetical protein